MAQATRQHVCEACGKPARAGVERDSAGNLLCAQCAAALHAAVEPPPELTAPSSEVLGRVDSAPPLPYMRPRAGTPTWSDFWDFRWMITPMVIRGAFLLGTLACVALGLVGIFQGMGWGTLPGKDHWMAVQGMLVVLVGPIVLRLIAESLIVFFKIHSALESMDRKLQEV